MANRHTRASLSIPENALHERSDGLVAVTDPTRVTTPDSLLEWVDRYQRFAVAGVRSPDVARKIGLQLSRFVHFFQDAYGHDRLSACLRRDVVAWQQNLVDQGLAPATINNHLAALSAFTSWVSVQAPRLFPFGDPAKGVSELGLPPLEPRALTDAQVRSLKNLCDRLPRLLQKKGRRWQERDTAAHAYRRPWRDRALVFFLLSTGLRREELVNVDLAQVQPHTPAALRAARRATVLGVRGKGKSQRTVFLSADARTALADYLEHERPRDATAEATALFLSAAGVAARRPDGRLSVRSINLILEQLGRLHDAEQSDPARRLAPLRPHDLRHTFAFQLARTTGADGYELERRLGHRSQRYIQRYTNPPEHVAAEYIERF